jgi:hypothetical protein
MPLIHLIIPDIALRGAVTEQLTLGQMNSFAETAQVVDSIKDNDAKIIILDESALDKRAAATLANTDKTVLVLGAEGQDIGEAFPKPLRLGHLLSRLKYHLETAPRLRGVTTEFGGLKFESQNRHLIVIDTADVIRLTEKETALLAFLAQSSVPVTREELLAEIWGYDGRIDTHTLESHIYQLRRKIDAVGKGIDILINENGAYRLVGK